MVKEQISHFKIFSFSSCYQITECVRIETGFNLFSASTLIHLIYFSIYFLFISSKAGYWAAQFLSGNLVNSIYRCLFKFELVNINLKSNSSFPLATFQVPNIHMWPGLLYWIAPIKSISTLKEHALGQCCLKELLLHSSLKATTLLRV